MTLYEKGHKASLFKFVVDKNVNYLMALEKDRNISLPCSSNREDDVQVHDYRWHKEMTWFTYKNTF